MKHSGSAFRNFLGAAFFPALFGCTTLANSNLGSNPVVGAWLVREVGAPFPYHMYVFNADGTMQQANPDAGDKTTSDSDGKGVWVVKLSYDIAVKGNSFVGSATFRSYDVNGAMVDGRSHSTLSGERVALP